MKFKTQYTIKGHGYHVYQDDDGTYHIDMDGRKDIHGPMTAEALINWMSHTIHALTYEKTSKV